MTSVTASRSPTPSPRSRTASPKSTPRPFSQFILYAKVVARTKSRIRSALIYPTLLLVLSGALLGVLINFVLPNFADFYKDFDAPLPLLTEGLIEFAVFVRGHWLLWLAVAFVAALGFRAMRRREATRIWLEKMKLKIPLGKVIWVESAVALFCRTLSLLLQAGVSLLTSVGLASQAMPNKYLVSRTAGLESSIKNGEPLSESLIKTGIFPALAMDMVRIGETSANLGGMLREVADVYDESIQARIDTFVSLIEPLMIICMGLLVAVMLLSVYTPIFNMIKVAR
jgi:type IV pilus assembly protein PilC